MPDLADGTIVRGADLPPTVADSDETSIVQISATTYTVGAPEVGVVFVAPTSGRVRLTVGGGERDSAGVDRVFLSPQVFRGTDATGVEVLAPSVTNRGLGSCAATKEFQYGSRTSLLEGLTPGVTYYARVMYTISPGGATPAGQADVGARDIVVIPVS